MQGSGESSRQWRTRIARCVLLLVCLIGSATNTATAYADEGAGLVTAVDVTAGTASADSSSDPELAATVLAKVTHGSHAVISVGALPAPLQRLEHEAAQAQIHKPGTDEVWLNLADAGPCLR